MLGPFTAIIDQVLRDDRDAPPKQRHTAAQLFRRLQEEHGYPGSYPTVRRYVCAHRQDTRPTFIPLAHPPGRRLEADFGHIHVDFPDGRRLVPFLVTVWAYSNAPFVIVLPTERVEAVLHGMVRALEFFDASPREVWWDNPKTVAATILRGRQRLLHPRYETIRQLQVRPLLEGGCSETARHVALSQEPEPWPAASLEPSRWARSGRSPMSCGSVGCPPKVGPLEMEVPR